MCVPRTWRASNGYVVDTDLVVSVPYAESMSDAERDEATAAYDELLKSIPDDCGMEWHRVRVRCVQSLRSLRTSVSRASARSDRLDAIFDGCGVGRAKTYDDLVIALVRCGYEVARAGGDPTAWAVGNMSRVCDVIWDIG